MKRKKFCVENGVFHPILVWGKNLYFCRSTKINTKLFYNTNKCTSFAKYGNNDIEKDPDGHDEGTVGRYSDGCIMV